nr:hypothetical protein [Pseudomonadota bacterium]
MGRKLGLVVLAVFVLLGCDNAISDKLLDELTLRYASQVDTAKKYLALEQAHELGPLEDKTDPVWKDAQLHTNLEKVAAVFPDAAPLSVKVIGLRRGFFNGKSGESTMTTVTLEYE